jgi:hypothetical protein
MTVLDTTAFEHFCAAAAAVKLKKGQILAAPKI